MRNNQLQLLYKRRFLPLFITQLFQAFNDCAFKSAMAVLIAYRLTASGFSEEIMVTLAGGIFILPFFLFSATAGQLADKYDKAVMIRTIKIFEIVFIVMGAAGFILANTTLLLITLFLMGTHSAFFGPVKYSILPDQLPENELIRGNALLEASTFVSILIGTIVGTKVILAPAGVYILSLLMLGLAVTGWVSSLYIPKTQASMPDLRINKNIFKETWNIVQHTRDHRYIFLAIIGISWFWLVGATFLQQFFTYTKDVLHANTGVTALFQAIFTVGIATGSLLCNKMLADEINAKYVPISVLCISLFIFDLAYASGHTSALSNIALVDTTTFLRSANNWRLIIDTLGISICGGFYVIPLYAILQSRSEKGFRSRTVACNNIVNSFYMAAGAILTSILLMIHFSITQVFVTIGLVNLFAAAYLCKMLPVEIRQRVFRWILSKLFDVEVNGMENYMQASDRMVIMANHTSLLDIMLISAFLPDMYTIAVDRSFAKKWWVQPFITLVDTFLIDPTSPISTKKMINEVRKGKKFLIFPEGKLTSTGSLMKVYEAPGLIALQADATILPVRIEGAKHSLFSRAKGKVNRKWFPKISLTILPPYALKTDLTLSKRERRQKIANELYLLMTDMIFASSSYRTTLFDALLQARTINGGGFEIAEDTERKPITYNQFIARTFILGKAISKQTQAGEHVGLMMPTTIAGMISFFALQAYGRIPAMLNFSAGISNLLSACETGQIKTIYTSKKFILTAKLDELIQQLQDKGLNVIYLESFRGKIGLLAKIRGLITGRIGNLAYKACLRKTRATDPGVLLFTSGSEGVPKAVVLSHQNILANCQQLLARVDFTSRDVMFNALPIFHCFGLTAGAILPITNGVKTFLYPSPLHYRIVPELVYDTNATIFFGTDTFLNGYARYAHPYDFFNVRMIFAGAEKLKEETRQQWAEKFGVRVYEGYGATETAPVVSTNTPLQNKPGAVGVFLPNMQYKLEPVEGIHEGGKLLVSGPNIMLGYIKSDNPGQIVPPKDGWYDTGDIVDVDSDGFIFIKGRAKRFAKIGGEMVSLTAVELIIKKLWPDYQHAVVSVPDPKKGEQLILLTENSHADRATITSFIRDNGFNELSIPKKIITTEEVPAMATGKIDYKEVMATVAAEL